MNTLTKQQTEQVLNMVAKDGSPCVVGEYRSARVEKLELTDKDSGERVPRFIVKHLIESMKGEPLVVAEWLPRGSDASKVVFPFTKGEPVLIQLTYFRVQRGQFELNGTIVKLGGVAS